MGFWNGLMLFVTKFELRIFTSQVLLSEAGGNLDGL